MWQRFLFLFMWNAWEKEVASSGPGYVVSNLVQCDILLLHVVPPFNFFHKGPSIMTSTHVVTRKKEGERGSGSVGRLRTGGGGRHHVDVHTENI